MAVAVAAPVRPRHWVRMEGAWECLALGEGEGIGLVWGESWGGPESGEGHWIGGGLGCLGLGEGCVALCITSTALLALRV